MGFIGDMLSGGNGAGFKARGPTDSDIKQANADTRNSIIRNQRFAEALSGYAQSGMEGQQNVYNQLSGIAQGQGPNPAQAMLNQATGANTANQAALMAGQRGATVNPGLIARMAAQQGAMNQQNAIGQGATLQAQQSLGALNSMGNLANQQVGQHQSALNSLGQQTLGQQGNVYGLQQNANSANAQIAQQNAQSQSNIMGNLLGAAGTVIGGIYGGPAGAAAGGAAGSAVGGAVDKKAEGGPVTQLNGPRSMIGQHFAKMASGGQVPALVSPGERYLPPSEVAKAQSGANPMQLGEKIPGKPKVGGAKNSYANDTVPKQLEEGGIVLPRSVTQSKDAGEKAKRFVEACLAKQNMKGK